MIVELLVRTLELMFSRPLFLKYHRSILTGNPALASHGELTQEDSNRFCTLKQGLRV